MEEQIKSTITSSYEHVKEAYDVLEELGADMPENKNIENLAATIDSLDAGSSWDPENPTLDGLKDALDKGEDVAIGTEIPDEYNGVNNPLVVVKQGIIDGSDGKQYNGVYLQRKFVTNVGELWHNSGGNSTYNGSKIFTFLNTTYQENCSSDIQDIISEVRVPVNTNTGVSYVNVKWFLPSVEEVYGDPTDIRGPGVGKEGNYFPYWKDNMEVASPTNAANAGRVAKDTSESGEAAAWWLRTTQDSLSNVAFGVWSTGAISTFTKYSRYDLGVLPVCVITAPEPLPVPETPNSLENLRGLLNEGKEIKLGSEIEDTYNGVSNPLIVVAQREVETSDGNKVQGVYLQRKFITDYHQIWGSTAADYGSSPINTFLNDTYMSRCSAELQNMISSIKVPVVINTGPTTVDAKWFLPSIEEVYGDPTVAYAPGAGTEGAFFPYWKEKTGLSTPSNANNDGRAVELINDSVANWWLRSRDSLSVGGAAWLVTWRGNIASDGPQLSNRGVLPVCVVTAN